MAEADRTQIHFAPLYLGIIGSGASFTGANPGYTARELAHHIKITNASILLSELKTLPVAIEAAAERGIPQTNIFILNFKDEPVPGPSQSWTTFLQHGEKDWVTIDDPHATAAFVSTSGTSGLPKAAILPHSYLISQGRFQETLVKENEEVMFFTANLRHKLINIQISTLIAVPPFHVFTMPVQHALPLRTCSSAYIMPRFEEKGFIRAVGEFKITQTPVVPPILMTLTRRTREELDSLRKVFVGGSVTTSGMQQQLYSQMHPDAKIIQVYGMTEVGWATTWTREEKDKSGSVGQAIPDTTLRYTYRDFLWCKANVLQTCQQ
jgi:acyl-CoA synthetase (AMP-forming)/AMP-acid ligase II